MPDPKRIGISGQSRGIDPQRQRRNSFTTDEAVAAPLTLNQRGQITLQLSGPFQLDSEGNLVLNVAPPLTITNNSPLTLGLALDPSLTVINGKLAPALAKSDIQRPGLAPRLTGIDTNFLAGDGTYRAVPVTPTDLGYTAATRELTSSTGADVTLPLFTSTDAGLTPASGGGTIGFLRADETWAQVNHADVSGLTDNDHVLYLDIEDYQQVIGANPDQCYIANCRTGVALGTITLTADRTYWIPFVAPARGGTLEDVRLQITTAAAGQDIRIALYDCVSDVDGKPLTSDFRPVGGDITNFTQSMAATGTFVFNFAVGLTAGRMYWYCIMSSGAGALRAVSTNEADMGLGWTIPSGTTAPNAITYWYETITYSSGLPTKTGTESYTNGTGAAPAVFHTWSA